MSLRTEVNDLLRDHLLKTTKEPKTQILLGGRADDEVATPGSVGDNSSFLFNNNEEDLAMTDTRKLISDGVSPAGGHLKLETSPQVTNMTSLTVTRSMRKENLWE